MKRSKVTLCFYQIKQPINIFQNQGRLSFHELSIMEACGWICMLHSRYIGSSIRMFEFSLLFFQVYNHGFNGFVCLNRCSFLRCSIRWIKILVGQSLTRINCHHHFKSLSSSIRCEATIARLMNLISNVTNGCIDNANT